MEEIFCCTICMHTYDEDKITPMCLPCGHTYCFICLLSVKSSTCPECDEPYELLLCKKNQEIIRSLRIWICMYSSNDQNIKCEKDDTSKSIRKINTQQLLDIPLCEICENRKCNFYCAACSKNRYLCTICFLFRHLNAPLSLHKQVPWNKSLSVNMCSEHFEQCLIYCTEHNKAICHICYTDGKHKGHSVSLISTEYEMCRAKLKESICELESSVMVLQAISNQASQTYIILTIQSFLGAATDDSSDMSLWCKEEYGLQKAICNNTTILHDNIRDGLIDQISLFQSKNGLLLRSQITNISVEVSNNISLSSILRRYLEAESKSWLVVNMSELMETITNQLISDHKVVASATQLPDRLTSGTHDGILDMHDITKIIQNYYPTSNI